MKKIKFLSTIIAATLLLVACEAEELNPAEDSPQNLLEQQTLENPNPIPTDDEDDMPGQDGDFTDDEDDMPDQGGSLDEDKEDKNGDEGTRTDDEDDMPGQNG